MTNEYHIGYAAGKNDHDGFSLDGKTPEFIDGFCQAKRDEEFLSGNPDVDSFDY